MTRVAACYFCGTVVESPEPTPLLPEALREGDGPTVDLCADCRARYDTVRETVADAVEERGDVAPGQMQGVDGEVATDDGVAESGDERGELGDEIGEPGDQGPDGDGAGADHTEGAVHDADASTDGDADADGSTDSDASDGALEDVSVSRADFQRVMRLLENRDLPVERDEIEVVASNAYDVPRETCAAILEAAAERGHVALEDGRVVAAE